VVVTERTAYLLAACGGKTVLHLGCSDSPYTEVRLKDHSLLFEQIDTVAARQIGLDFDPEGVGRMVAAGLQRVYVGDANDPGNEAYAADRFDIIIAGEIIEHIADLGAFLGAIRALMERDGAQLILTTVNAYCGYRFVQMLLTGRENVHPDHICYFSRGTLETLLRRASLRIVDFAYYPVGSEHKRGLNKGRTRLLWWVDKIARRWFPQLSDGLIALCAVESL